MDEDYKVDLWIMQFKEEDKTKFAIGDHIQITAAVTENKGILFFNINLNLIYKYNINIIFLFIKKNTNNNF